MDIKTLKRNEDGSIIAVIEEERVLSEGEINMAKTKYDELRSRKEALVDELNIVNKELDKYGTIFEEEESPVEEDSEE